MILGNYKRDGYCILRGAVRADETWEPEVVAAVHDDLRKTHAQSVEAYLQKVRLMSKFVAVHKMFCNQAIYEACIQLGVRMPIFLSDPAIHIIADDLKIPGGYDGVGSHQDWPALQASLNAVTIWIPLHTVTIDNFPVEVVTGSHKLGLLAAKANAHYSEVETSGMEFQPIEVHRGDALIFSVFTIHRTRVPGRGMRISYSHRYHDGMDKHYVEGGYYSAQRRAIEREIKRQPTAEQVQKVFA